MNFRPDRFVANLLATTAVVIMGDKHGLSVLESALISYVLWLAFTKLDAIERAVDTQTIERLK